MNTVIGVTEKLGSRIALRLIGRGEKVRRSHMPAGMLKVMKTVSRSINPGLSYLIDTTLAE